ncbi:protein phosphatase [Phakopsora pachyrhizi]|nr:protein phosphatase [Phakopsora pachyrhizi]
MINHNRTSTKTNDQNQHRSTTPASIDTCHQASITQPPLTPNRQLVTSPPVVQSPGLINQSFERDVTPIVSRRGKMLNSPNAKSVEVTQLRAGEQFVPGIANQHPPVGSVAAKHFKVGVSEDRNRKCRRTMEDSHSFLYSFGDLHGQGYFAIFDGHAGKHAAEWCGEWFHEYLLYQLSNASRSTPVPDLLNSTFHIVDTKLSQLAAEDGTHSGCTAVTAFLRLEYSNGEPVGEHGAGVSSKTISRVTSTDLNIGGDLENRAMEEALDGTEKATIQRQAVLDQQGVETGAQKDLRCGEVKRTLYTANVGDARAVLCRGGHAVRLTYDHKGSDQKEAQRIMDAGGFVMNNRVNGVLAVTRSLGDSSMKEFVVGSPYTTETTLGNDDQFLIIACDGLWDVCEDQDAVNLISEVSDPQEASRILLDHALSQFSTDNLSVMVISLKPKSFYDVATL